MAYIYKITNIINNKCYIGKTLKTVQDRWKEHCQDYLRRDEEKRPLYSAMKKYGIKNFKIEEIEQCSENIVNEREKYWIQYFNSYRNGYNATLGGDGKAYLDRKKVIELYNKHKIIAVVADKMNCSTEGVSNILKQEGIKTLNSRETAILSQGKKVAMLDKDTGQILKIFTSISKAEEYLQINYRSHIYKVCNGERKTFKGYKWKWI